MATPVDPAHVAAVRAFTRYYTATLEVLEEGLLDTPYSVTEARVIFELAQQDAVELVDLRQQLRIDAGYMSRILNRFEADGLVVREASEVDARRQVLRLTPAGRAVFDTLDQRSARQVEGLLAEVPEADRQRLVEAMATVRTIMGDDRPPPRTVLLRAPTSGDYGWVVARHGALYAAEYGWDETFEGLVARIVGDFVADHEPAREAAWIAELDGKSVACVFCVAKDDTTAQLRLLLVEPSARGLGIGARLVRECLAFAERAGYGAITLWTNDVLESARRLYEAAGFELVNEEPHHSFGHDLMGQYWTRDLQPRPRRARSVRAW